MTSSMRFSNINSRPPASSICPCVAHQKLEIIGGPIPIRARGDILNITPVIRLVSQKHETGRLLLVILQLMRTSSLNETDA